MDQHLITPQVAEHAASLLSAYNTQRTAQANAVANAEHQEQRMAKLTPGSHGYKAAARSATDWRASAGFLYERAVSTRKQLYELTGITVTF